MEDQRLWASVLKGVVQSVDDNGEAQTISVLTHDGVLRTDIEVMSIHGLASHPGEGAEALLLAVEGDQGHYVALPLSLFGQRFGGLKPGGGALYDDAGNRLHLPGDGTGLLTTAGLFRMLVQSLLIDAQGGTEVRGPVHFTADVVIDGNLSVGKDLHVTGNITAGGSITHG